ncbi:unnamed protein product [Ilex paraguariensis]|uniref:Pentatricopeptide repeat-containing protein n=1 Tax=Ilex paraguariensis TaxID=185542 RepID=A0ABC8RGI4_9AQUA
MGSWAIKAKITESITETCATNLLTRASSPYQAFPHRTLQRLLPSQFPLHNAHRKHLLCPFLPIKPFPFMGRTCSQLLHGSAYLCTAFHSFDEMPHTTQSFENAHFYHVLELIQFCTMKPNSLNVIMVHCLALKVGALAHLPISTSLLIVYSRAGDFGSAVTMSDDIRYKDVVVWNAMMTACIKNRHFGAALDFFMEMMEEGRGFDTGTLVIVVSALSNMHKLMQGRVVHGLSLKAGMLPDSFLCNALINMYAKCGDLSSSECMFVGTEWKDLVSWNSMVSSCLYNNYPEKSLWYFREMVSCGEQADHVSLSCAIAASSCLAELGIGQVIHGFVVKLAYQESSHNSVANSLISFYSECGDIDVAEIVFREMVLKDMISWNAMIDGFASNKKNFEAFDLLREMQLAGSVQPDKVTVVTTISICAELMLLREGKTLHGFTTRREMGSNLSVTNSLMDMYSKCNSVEAAEHLFQNMPERDLVSWNTMISGYSHNGCAREAQSLFKKLLHWCSEYSLSTLLAILPSCDSPEHLCLGKLIHCWQLKLEFSNNILAVNSIMFMYINCGDMVASFSLLWRMSAIADTACWNTVIVGCTQSGHFLEALGTFNLMKWEPHVTHDSITLVNVILACGNLELVLDGKLVHGLALKSSAGKDTRVQNALITMYGRFGDMESARLVFNFNNRNLCSWNCMMSAFSQNKDAKKVLELFNALDFEPDEITTVTILSACTQLGVLCYGLQIHGHVFRVGFQRNPFISAALVDMYSNCGRLDISLNIFQSLKEKSVAACSMISAHGFHSNGRKATEVFHEMIESGTSPTKSTFINLLSACSHSGLVNEGICYYNHMFDKFGVEPVTEHHLCIVDMLGRSGRLHEAYDFVRQMPTPPEPGVWGALLSACNYYGDLELGREVANILFGLEPENVGYYISLSNMYVAAGRWSEAVKLRTTIQDNRLKKPAGYSLIDVGQQ